VWEDLKGGGRVVPEDTSAFKRCRLDKLRKATKDLRYEIGGVNADLYFIIIRNWYFIQLSRTFVVDKGWLKYEYSLRMSTNFLLNSIRAIK
jgi:hypothetical protein